MIPGKYLVTYITHVAKNIISTHFGKDPKCDKM